MRGATAWASRLAPSPGFAYSIDAYHSLDQPAKVVLDVFAKVRNYVSRVAGDHGAGDLVTSNDPEVEPSKVTKLLESGICAASSAWRAPRPAGAAILPSFD